MTIERYCTEKGCPGGGGCILGRKDEKICVFEYVASEYKPEHRWSGEGDPPRKWFAADGTMIYRSYADYCA